MKKNILSFAVVFALAIAKITAGTASWLGIHEPVEPEAVRRMREQ